MLILHHTESESSRALLATKPTDAAVVDCSGGIPADYSGPQPSAYPSVVVDVPAYMADVADLDGDGGFVGMTRVMVAAHQEILRLPASWAAVAEYMAYVTARAAANPVV